MQFMKMILDAIFPPRESELFVRNCKPEQLLAQLRPTVVSDPSVVTSSGSAPITLLPYKDELVQACILEAKFHNNARAASLLGHILHKYLSEFIRDNRELLQEKIIFVPVPLSRSRRQERGYNQAERIAQFAVAGLENTVQLESLLLIRTRDTTPQTSLNGDARRKNISGAFATSRACSPDYTYIVFDDVITTGATLSIAVETLKNAGAEHVVSLALAH